MNPLNMDGFLLLDKASGCSSNYALQQIKRLYQTKKAGHTGSLDPLASGMLPIAFGQATKFARFLLDAEKCYQFTCRLGITTTTGDQEGEVLTRQAVPTFSTADILEMAKAFEGSRLQIPPMYSALKHQGQPLYRLARQGKVIERAARPIVLYEVKVEKIEEDNTLITFTVRCSKGTYIRRLAEEMGDYLGCGAHVVSLRRLWSAPFQKALMHSLVALTQSSLSHRLSLIFPICAVMEHCLPFIRCNSQERLLLQQGQSLPVTNLVRAGWVGISEENGDFIGVGEIDSEARLLPRRLLHFVAAAAPMVVKSTV